MRVIATDGKQLGVLSLGEALTMARSSGVDLVEIAPNATPPVCRLVDYGKYRYEQAKRDKESKKHQHATRVKEVQLSPKIDPHDLGVKTQHAIDFLCEDMKVKITLKFRGREMAHTEFGFDVIRKFLAAIAPYGHQDFEPKLIGKGINVMISPLPRNKRAKNPHQTEGAEMAAEDIDESELESAEEVPLTNPAPTNQGQPKPKPSQPTQPARPNEPGRTPFANNPFAQLEIK